MEIARIYGHKRLAPQVGFEPTNLRLTAGCSAIELLRSVWAASACHDFGIVHYHSILVPILKTIRPRATRHSARDSIDRIASSESDRLRLARSCFMCSALEVPVIGSISTARAKANTIWAGVAFPRAARSVTSGCWRTSGFAVRSENP